MFNRRGFLRGLFGTAAAAPLLAHVSSAVAPRAPIVPAPTIQKAVPSLMDMGSVSTCAPLTFCCTFLRPDAHGWKHPRDIQV